MKLTNQNLQDAKNIKNDEFYTPQTLCDYVFDYVYNTLGNNCIYLLGADQDWSTFVKYAKLNNLTHLYNFDILNPPVDFNVTQEFCLVTNPPFSKLNKIIPLWADLIKKHTNIKICLFVPLVDMQTKYFENTLKDVNWWVYKIPSALSWYYSNGKKKEKIRNIAILSNIPNLLPMPNEPRIKYDFSLKTIIAPSTTLFYFELFKKHGYNLIKTTYQATKKDFKKCVWVNNNYKIL